MIKQKNGAKGSTLLSDSHRWFYLGIVASPTGHQRLREVKTSVHKSLQLF